MAGEVVTAYRHRNAPIGIFRWLTTTNHHEIGILYLANSFFFFLIGGVLALLMRTELAYPGPTIVDANTYEQLFTMHGTTMIFLVSIPILAGFGNLMVPPLIGAKDMAFPRINALSFWIIPVAGVIMWMGAANIGWTGYTPLSVYDTSSGVDMWIVGLQLLGISSTAGAINFLVTILRHRAPGITFKNLSLFVWSILVRKDSSCWRRRSSRADCSSSSWTAMASRRSSRLPSAAIRSCGNTCSGSTRTPPCTS